MRNEDAARSMARTLTKAIQRSLQENEERVVFQQLRVAPESLIVHLAAFELRKGV